MYVDIKRNYISETRSSKLNRSVCLYIYLPIPEHGEFWQTPANHLHGCGCQKCCSLPKKNTNDFIKEAKLIHKN